MKRFIMMVMAVTVFFFGEMSAMADMVTLYDVDFEPPEFSLGKAPQISGVHYRGYPVVEENETMGSQVLKIPTYQRYRGEMRCYINSNPLSVSVDFDIMTHDLTTTLDGSVIGVYIYARNQNERFFYGLLFNPLGGVFQVYGSSLPNDGGYVLIDENFQDGKKSSYHMEWNRLTGEASVNFGSELTIFKPEMFEDVTFFNGFFNADQEYDDIFYLDNVLIKAQPVPIPGAIWLLLGGLALLGLFKKIK